MSISVTVGNEQGRLSQIHRNKNGEIVGFFKARLAIQPELVKVEIAQALNKKAEKRLQSVINQLSG